MIMLQTFLILNMYFLVPYFSCIKFNSKIVSAITELNTSFCVRSSERINCSVRVWMRAIARTILRSLVHVYKICCMILFRIAYSVYEVERLLDVCDDKAKVNITWFTRYYHEFIFASFIVIQDR